MDEQKNAITSAYSDIIRNIRKFQLLEPSMKAIDQGNDIIKNGVGILKVLKQYTESLETALADCQDYVDEIREELTHEKPKDDFVFNIINGLLSYRGREFIDKNTVKKIEPLIREPEQKIERVCIQDISYMLPMRKVADLNDIPSMFCYYENPNDKENNPGVYCSVIPGVFARVAFPEVIDSTKDYARHCPIRCKYGDHVSCNENRKSMAKRYQSGVRICNFAHTGEKLIRIGHSSRCDYIPRFGNPNTINQDITVMRERDIRSVLMYGLNDLISTAVWMDYNKENIQKKVFDNLDIA